MKITKKQLRRIIRESLDNENELEAEIEEFLDAFQMKDVTRKMMKANVMKLPLDQRREFIKKRP